MVAKKVKCIYGYYESVKVVTYDKALKYKPYAQAGVKFEGDSVILISYESPILKLNSNTIEFYNTEPDYSRTTIGHVGAFLREYASTISYHQVKRAFHTDALNEWNISGYDLINAFTGEVI